MPTKDLKTKEVFIKYQAANQKKSIDTATKKLKDYQGSFITVSLVYDKDDPREVIGSDTLANINGNIHDVPLLLRALDHAKENLMDEALKNVNGHEALHILKHVNGDEK